MKILLLFICNVLSLTNEDECFVNIPFFIFFESMRDIFKSLYVSLTPLFKPLLYFMGNLKLVQYNPYLLQV